jgi:hypothetical protein
MVDADVALDHRRHGSDLVASDGTSAIIPKRGCNASCASWASSILVVRSAGGND